MVFNPNKFLFVVLADSNCTYNFTCNGTTIESSKQEKVLGITIDDKLTFTSHLGNIIKKSNQKFHALSRVKCYMGFEQYKLIISSFRRSQFSCCPLIWMVCLRTSMNKLNNIHQKCLHLSTNDYDSNFNELLELSHELSIHKICKNYLIIEIYKYLHGLSPEFMTDIFTLRKNPYDIRNIPLFCSENPRPVRFGVDAIAFWASPLWQKVPITIKGSSSVEIFEAKINLWSCDDCPCNLCKRFITNIVYI